MHYVQRVFVYMHNISSYFCAKCRNCSKYNGALYWLLPNILLLV